MPNECWYFAYGSNLDRDRFEEYFSVTRGRDRPEVIRSIDRELFFAGQSKRWGGGVAFISLNESPEHSSHVRGYRLTWEEMQELFHGENGISASEPIEEFARGIPIGECKEVPLPMYRGGSMGKYNALIRLEDVDGMPSFSFTTCRPLPRRRPSPDYVDKLLQGLGSIMPSVGSAAEYLDAAILRSVGESNAWAESLQLECSVGERELSLEVESGFPLARRLRNESPIRGVSLMRARETSGSPVARRLWIHFGPSAGTSIQSEPKVRIAMLPTHRWAWAPGKAGDIPSSDVIQVSPEDTSKKKQWVLVCTPHFPAPMRAEAKDHVKKGEVRIPYAARVLLALDKADEFGIQLLDGESDAGRPMLGRFWSHAVKASRMVGEFVIGAPVLALRATEGLAGDDGEAVVRVDPSALDFLGVTSGATVIVSWGNKAVSARVLLQSEVTAAAMAVQLAEQTGLQARATLTDVASRQRTPPHLRAWVSPTIRNRLEIPPDTIIRIRRSVPHFLFLALCSASIPLAGLTLAALALPDLPRFWIAFLMAIFVLINVLPMRKVSKSSTSAWWRNRQFRSWFDPGSRRRR